MSRIALNLIVGVAIGVGGLTPARPKGNGEHVKVLASYDLKEKLDGKEAAATIVEVKIGPGQEEASHRHPGPAFVYVVEGTYELGLDDQPTKVYKAGETFQEPSGCLHRVSRNPASSGDTRLIAVVLHPRSAKDIVIPAAHWPDLPPEDASHRSIMTSPRGREQQIKTFPSAGGSSGSGS